MQGHDRRVNTRSWGTRAGSFAAAVCAALFLSAPSAAQGPVFAPFSEEAASRGIVYPIPAPQWNGIYGFGAGFADLDNDGDPDIIVLGRLSGKIGVFENDGTGQFIDRSNGMGAITTEKPSAFAAGDLDGDGDIDLFVTQIDVGCLVLRNDGAFHFTDVSENSGTLTPGPVKAASLADFDGDGDLDIYVAVYRNLTPSGLNMPSSLYRNNGDGTFTDVAAQNGLTTPGYTFTGVWTDTDRDGDPDLYISNDRGYLPPYFQGNQLFRNDGGQMVEISEGSGANAKFFSMGVGVGDIDHNGFPDFYCTNLPNVNQPLQGKNPLFLNQGGNTFVRGDDQWGVGHVTVSWGAEMFDFDNDSNVDLYVSNQFEANTLYRNLGTPPVIDVTEFANCPGAAAYSYTSASADVDGDGDLDLLVSDLGSNVLLYINHEGETRNSVAFKIRGEGINRDSIGATAVAYLDEGGPPTFYDVHAGGRSFLGHHMPEVHIGLGTRTEVARIDIRWPMGTSGSASRTITNLPANNRWTIYSPARLGDFNGDAIITSVDRAAFQLCLAHGFLPGFEMMDMDGDSDIDADDLVLLYHKASDFDGDGVVGSSDLAILLGAWGTRGGVHDLDDSGVVGSGDLATLLGSWGKAGG